MNIDFLIGWVYIFLNVTKRYIIVEDTIQISGNIEIETLPHQTIKQRKECGCIHKDDN